MNQQTTNNYDSEFCGNLPIHLINVIQPYGVLVVVDKASGLIVQASENVSSLVNMPVGEVVKKPFTQFFSHDPLLLEKPDLPQQVRVNDKVYLGIYHDNPSYFILEVNLESEHESSAATFIDVYHELKEAMKAIDAATSIKQIIDVAAAELKRSSGFDKVMIYRFDENWNGHVLAEVKEPGMEAYLGLTFPASDIPRQARDLYLKNAYRFIPDRDYAPVKLYPVINPVTHTFLDMSTCNVRGVTTVHLEYLRNMKVTASMSTRIIKDGKLWGLIACHHRTAMQMSYKLCTVFELLSGIISTKTAALESKEIHIFNTGLADIYTSLVEETYRSSRLVDTLLNDDTNIMRLFNAEGAVISYNGNTVKRGAVPESNDIEDILLWLNSRHDDDVYYTNQLSHEYDYATEFRDVASGLLAIPVDQNRDEYILLFRPEVVQVINWGGDPADRINFEEDRKTYHPRHSFKIWQERVSGISRPWQNAELEMATNLREFVKAFLNGKDYAYQN